jgi:ComF family protein
LFCAPCGQPPEAPAEVFYGTLLLAGGLYAPPLSKAIQRFKYRGCSELARGLATLVDQRVGELELARHDLFVPVPLHPTRLADRGYDQAALLARALARRHSARFAPRLLERVRETPHQAGLERSARAKNMVGAFRQRQAIGSGRVVLVDDVVTTGATARACLRALGAAGSEVLSVVAVARARSNEIRPDNG